MVDRFSSGARFRSRYTWLLLCMLAICLSCSRPTNTAPDQSGDVAFGDEESPSSEGETDAEQPKFDKEEIPERLLEPDMQALVEKIEAWGGTADTDLGKLVTIDLDKTRIEDSDLREISKASNLLNLTLVNTGITDQGLAELVHLKKLNNLDCSGTKVSDEGMKSVAKLTELWVLRLSRTNVGDEGLQALTPLSKLDVLSLDGTRVTNAGLPALLDFPLLSSVNLSRTKIDDGSVDTLTRLKALEILYVEQTSLTDNGIDKLRTQLRPGRGKRVSIFAQDGTFKP